MTALLLFGVFAVLLLIGVPVAYSLGLAAAATLLYVGFFGDLSVMTSVMFSSLASETLLAIPFFILAGAIMEAAGISRRLIEFADACVGQFKHGLVMVVIVTAFIFSALSGSGPATVAAIGTILIPAMVRAGYQKKHAAALVGSAGSMGIVIPPSIAFIIFAVVVSEFQRVSIARLFVAGVVPGIVMAIALLIAAMTLPRVKESVRAASEAMTRSPEPALAGAGGSAGTPSGAGVTTSLDPAADTATARHASEHAISGEGFSGARLGRTFVAALPGLLVPVIILGGIYLGIFTPTESAVVAAVYALLVGTLVYREIKVTTLLPVFTTAATVASTVMLIVGAATVFGYVVTTNGVAAALADGLLGITDNRFVILFGVVVLLLVVGMFMDAVSALYLFVPIVAPVLLAVGVDVTAIGVLMVVNLAVGLITPPVGVNLFVAAGIARISLVEAMKGVWPFLIASFAVLLLITYVPALSTWLPDLLGV